MSEHNFSSFFPMVNDILKNLKNLEFEPRQSSRDLTIAPNDCKSQFRHVELDFKRAKTKQRLRTPNACKRQI